VSLICADDETTGKAAITGDFVLIASEANLVIKALRDNGIEVTALLSHLLTDSPHCSSCISRPMMTRSSWREGLRSALNKATHKSGHAFTVCIACTHILSWRFCQY